MKREIFRVIDYSICLLIFIIWFSYIVYSFLRNKIRQLIKVINDIFDIDI